MRRADAPSHGPREGFTLIEVVVALLLGVIAIGGARAVTGALIDHGRRLEAVHTDASESVNGERLLRQLVLEVEAGRSASSIFAGTPTRAAFDTWCRVPRGWIEACSVEFRIEPGSGDSLTALTARISTGESLTLGRYPSPVRFAYLEDAAHGGAWTAQWGPGTSAPLALGIFARDLLVIVPTQRMP